MAKIDVYTADLQELSAKLKRAEQTLSDVQSLVAGAQSGLSMKVAARENIDGRLSAVRSKIIRQNGKVGKMASLSMTSAQEFADADRGSGQKAQSVFAAVLGGLSRLTGGIGRFLVSTSAGRHAAIAGVFFTSGSLLFHSPLASLWDWFKGVSGKTEAGSSGNTHTSGSGVHNAPNTVPVIKTPGTTAPGTGGGTGQGWKLSGFDTGAYGKVSSGNYSNYSIVPGMKPDFVINQHSYSKPGFGKNGCTSSTYWTIASAYKGEAAGKPTDSYISGTGAANDKDKRNPATIWSATNKYTTPEQYLETIYKNLTQGIPIGARMKSKSGASGHTVSCIGLKNGASIESFKSSLAALDKSAPDYQKKYDVIIKDFQKNILISDSADGKIKTLDSYQFSIGKSLWYPDGAPVVK